MINLLVQGLMGVASDAIGGYVETKKAKAKQNGDKYEAMSEYDLKRAASDIVKATAQSYSQAVPLVRGLAKSPYGVMFAPFIRFKGEVVRIVVNTLRIGVKEIRDSNPVIFWRGVKRLECKEDENSD